MQPARFRQADISLVKIDNAMSMSPAVSSGRSADSFPEQRLVIEPRGKNGYFLELEKTFHSQFLPC